MKLILAMLVLLVFALSFWADHKWRQWMKARRKSQADQPPADPTHRG
jgi:hypothetical protein